jgi:hypothetical protein
MSKKTTVNKTHAIRDEARKLIAAGMLPRPREIIRILREKKIEVSSPQVTMACKGTGLMLRDQRNKQKDALPKHHPISTQAIRHVSLEELSKARDFVNAIGSLDKAISALDIFSQFKQEPDPKPEPEPEPEQEYYGGA